MNEKKKIRRKRKRINITIPEDYLEILSVHDLNLSGFITDLIGDYLAGHTISIQVSEETKRLYEYMIANFEHSDESLEVLLREALVTIVNEQIETEEAKFQEKKRKLESVKSKLGNS
ncbi:hypothetical protein N9850_06345 [Granulosicoccus sp.]|nr:hypothetical protein [Granulosicoccus sp.]MDB4223373.1 hypothetical protein [Granulosicoccus sp.]